MIQLSALALLLSAAVIGAETRTDVPNDRFSEAVSGVNPITWEEFERQGTAVREDCSKSHGGDSAHACAEKLGGINVIAFDALVYAAAISKRAGKSEKRFCDSNVDEMIVNGKSEIDGPIVAMLTLEQWVAEKRSVYGDDLKQMYVAKLMYDAMVDESPCAE